MFGKVIFDIKHYIDLYLYSNVGGKTGWLRGQKPQVCLIFFTNKATFSDFYTLLRSFSNFCILKTLILNPHCYGTEIGYKSECFFLGGGKENK